MSSIIVKLTAEDIALVGAKDGTEFAAKFPAFAATAKRMESVMAEQPTIAALEARIKTLETAAPAITETRVKELITAETAVPIKTFLTGAEGKTIIGAEASRIVMEAMAASGTTPAKPSPAAPGADNPEQLEAAGEYEKAFAASKDIRAEFSSWQHYAAFAKANSAGRITFNRPQTKAATN